MVHFRMTKKMIMRTDLSMQDKFIYQLIRNQPDHFYKSGLKGLVLLSSNQVASIRRSIHWLEHKHLIKPYKSHRETKYGARSCTGYLAIK